MHKAMELFGWFILIASTGFGLTVVCMIAYYELWDTRIKRYEEPRVCTQCGVIKVSCVAYCQDCVDRVQRKLGEKW